MIEIDAVHWVAGGVAYIALAILLFGLWQGTRRRTGRIIGHRARWLAIPWFYLVATVIFLGIGYALWQPLTNQLSRRAQDWLLVLGSILYFPGVSLTLWARWALGRNYFASSALAVRLFEDHQLVTTGPYEIVRHPMYLGLMLAAFGSVAIYHTWTTVMFAACAIVLLLRARKEEQALALEFREVWTAYCRRVPMFLPRLRPSKRLISQEQQL